MVRSLFYRMAGLMLLLIGGLAMLGLSGLQFEPVQALLDQRERSGPPAPWAVVGDAPVTMPTDGGISIDTLAGVSAHASVPSNAFDGDAQPWLRWVRFSATVDANIASFGVEQPRPPVVSSWFETSDGSRKRVSPREVRLGVTQGRELSDVRAIPDGSARAVIGVFMRTTLGVIAVERPHIEIVALSRDYVLALLALLLGTVILTGLLLADNEPVKLLRRAAVPIALIVAILLLVSLTSTLVDATVRPLVGIVLGERMTQRLEGLFTLGHAIAFALLAMALSWQRRALRLTPWRILVVLLLLAVGSEVLQLHVPGRNSEYKDLLADGLGAVAGLACWTFLDRFGRRFIDFVRRRLRDRSWHKARSAGPRFEGPERRQGKRRRKKRRTQFSRSRP